MFSFLYNILIKNKEFKIVCQKSENDCGLAVLACLGYSYDKLAKEFSSHKNGVSVKGMMLMLDYVRKPYLCNFIRGTRQKIKDYSNQTGIYLIRSPRDKFGHWILLDKYNNVYDTYNNEIVLLSKYDRKNNTVIAQFVI